jgi:hypothetical protein
VSTRAVSVGKRKGEEQQTHKLWDVQRNAALAHVQVIHLSLRGRDLLGHGIDIGDQRDLSFEKHQSKAWIETFLASHVGLQNGPLISPGHRRLVPASSLPSSRWYRRRCRLWLQRRRTRVLYCACCRWQSARWPE